MSLFQRSFSFGPSSSKCKESNIRKDSVFASAWSLLVGADKNSHSTLDSPGLYTEGHLTRQDAWMQACYTAMALIFVFISACIFLSVFYILEPFLHPLLWAVLVGMVLHPFKHASTSEIHNWLSYLDSSGIPLSVGLVLSPLFAFNWLSQCFEKVFLSNWKTILGFLVCAVSLTICYAVSLPVYIYEGAQMVRSFIDSANTFMEHTTMVQLCSLILGFVSLLILTMQYSGYKMALRCLSMCLWFLAFLNVGVCLCGPLALPVVLALFFSSVMISMVKASQKHLFKKRKKEFSSLRRSKSMTSDKDSLLEKGITLNTIRVMKDSDNCLALDSDEIQTQNKADESNDTQPLDSEVSPPNMPKDGISAGEVCQVRDDKSSALAQVDTTGDREHMVSFNPYVEQQHQDHPEKPRGSSVPDLPEQVSTYSKRQPMKSRSQNQKTKDVGFKYLQGSGDVDGGRAHRLAALLNVSNKARAQSNQVFLLLLAASLMVIMWKYPILLLIPVPLVLWSVIKYIVSLAIVQNSVLTHVPSSLTPLKTWMDSQHKILFPWPMPTMLQTYVTVDNKVLGSLKRMVGSLMSAFIILVLLVGVLAVMILVLFQVQVEVMHYLNAAVTVWNTAVATNPQIKEWMGVADKNETLHDTLETFASRNYVYVREWLADMIHSLVRDSKLNTTLVEARVLEMFDRLYSSYVVQNSSSSITNTCTRNDSVVNSSTIDVATGYVPPNAYLLRTVNELLPLVSWDTVVTVMKSLWLIVFDNLSVAFSFLYAILELLFSGGTALLNTIVFLTTLFYLLSYSEGDYLPVKWIMDSLPQLTSGNVGEEAASTGGVSEASGDTEQETDGDKNHGKVFSRAIRSVFHATFRRALFYGLYTWLIHTLFGLPVSILPAVLAGITGAIPFVGSYWVSVPAVLDLWLLEDRLLSALGLLSLSLLPVFFVDTIINREIEGGHPYLTGLAIAGGIYFAGLEGALIGPILLSCLLFVVDLYEGSFF